MTTRRGTLEDSERQSNPGGIEMQNFPSSSSAGGIDQQQSSDEVSGPDNERRGLGFRLTGYRLITLSSLLAFSIAKAVQSYRNSSVSANTLDFVYGGGLTFVLIILGYVQEDQKHRWPGFFVVDYWSLTLNAVQDMQFKDRILLKVIAFSQKNHWPHLFKVDYWPLILHAVKGVQIIDHILLKVINIFAYILLLSSNVYVVAGPERIYKESYFTPASWGHVILWPIHLLLLGYIVYQFFPSGERVIINDIGWRFPLSAAVASVYLTLRSRQYYVLAFFLSLWMRLAVSDMYYIFMRPENENPAAEIFVNVPISLYRSLADILLVTNAFEAFGINAHTESAGRWTEFFVIFAHLSLFFRGLGYWMWYDFRYPTQHSHLVVFFGDTWLLSAIYARQRGLNPFIDGVAWRFAALSSCFILTSLINSGMRRWVAARLEYVRKYMPSGKRVSFPTTGGPITIPVQSHAGPVKAGST